MPSILKYKPRTSLRKRSERLRPDAAARWGDLTAPQMLSHVIQSLRMAAGEVKVPPEPGPWWVTAPPGRQLLIRLLPLPRGRETFPSLPERPSLDPATATEEQWRAELAEFERAVRAAAARSIRGNWPLHPVFGWMSNEEWGTLLYRHADQHFRQFGV